MIIFVHGVPDTPHLWHRLISSLQLSDADYFAPALPGFGCDWPEGFEPDKDYYAEWLINQVINAGHGEPVDIVGHDWGSLLTLRVASLRPDLIRSWCVANAVIDPNYRGHRTARMWATPILGEIVMLALRNTKRLESSLVSAGMPADLAAIEAPAVDLRMRQSILGLYRSANGLNFRDAWVDDLVNLPPRGQIYWGENDPYIDLSVARRFAEHHKVPLAVEPGAGHWACSETAGAFALLLKEFWRREAG